MSKRFSLLAAVPGALIAAGVAYAQYPIMDMVANKVIQKYQSSTLRAVVAGKGARPGQQSGESSV